MEWIISDKLREQKYKEIIKSSDPFLLVGMIKSIYIRKLFRSESGKKNTAIDERYYKLAETMLCSEIAFVLGKNKEEIKEHIFETIKEECIQA